MKIFSRKKFIEVEGIDDYNIHKFWVDLCNNREVIDGRIEIDRELYFISDYWCIDKSNKPLSIKFNKLYIITVLFDETKENKETYHLIENGRAFMKEIEFKISKYIVTEFKIGRNYISLELIYDDKEKHTIKYIIKEYKEKTHN